MASNEFPPSYDEATGQRSVADYRSQLAQYLAELPCATRRSQQEYQSRQDRRDTACMALVADEVGAFLAYLGALPRQPSGAELVLVPESSVPEQWELSGGEERRKQGAVVRIVRVPKRDAKAAKDVKKAEQSQDAQGSEPGEFDEWGRWSASDSPVGGSAGSAGSASDGYWWQDEALARRLARFLSLSLTRGTKAEPVPTAAEATAAKLKAKQSWLPWSSRKPAAVAVPARHVEAVCMAARAEEVTFRQQNELGIYESLTGWGIVLRVF